MRRRAPSPRLKTGTAGDGPADTATVVIGLAAGEQAEGPAAGVIVVVPPQREARRTCLEE
jgi:hypothetical protein